VTRLMDLSAGLRTLDKAWVLDRACARRGKSQGIGTEEQKGLPKVNYHLDVSDPDVAVLRRQDGTFVAAFSVSGATREGISEAAEEDYRNLLQAHSSGSLGHREDDARTRSA
jgi:hypothetical protein